MADLASPSTPVAVMAEQPTGDDILAQADPFRLFDEWYETAAASEVNDPNAMALATVDANGVPNVRIVLLRGLDGPEHGPERGFVFYTNTKSAKGNELLGHPHAALLFHWKSLRRQIRIRGRVTMVSAAEADAYYATRARVSRLGAWASHQSQPLADRAVLEAEVARLDAYYGPEADIPRPPHWSGYRVNPIEIEFWCERPFRLHDRAVFTRTHSGSAWTRTRLYP